MNKLIAVIKAAIEEYRNESNSKLEESKLEQDDWTKGYFKGQSFSYGTVWRTLEKILEHTEKDTKQSYIDFGNWLNENSRDDILGLRRYEDEEGCYTYNIEELYEEWVKLTSKS